MTLALDSMFVRKPRDDKIKLDSPLFYDPNPQGVQVWFSLDRQTKLITAHLQDGEKQYQGSGKTNKRALKALENAAPKMYHHTINYMRVCVWLKSRRS